MGIARQCVRAARQLPRGQRRWRSRMGRPHCERARARACRLAAGAGRASRGERRPRSSMVHWARVLTLTLTVNLNTDPALATDPDPSLSPSSSPHQVGGWAAAAMRDRCPSRGERGARGGAVRPRTAPWRSRVEGRPAQPGLCAVELRRAQSNVPAFLPCVAERAPHPRRAG